MVDLWKRLPEGTGKAVNKKQMQDFIKAVLYEKSLGDITDMVNIDYAEMTGAALGVIQTVNEAAKSGDFAKLRPLLDYAFERDAGAGRKK